MSPRAKSPASPRMCAKPLSARLSGTEFAARCVLDAGHSGPCKSYVEVLRLERSSR
jgi:hypothetical protein